MVICGNCKNYVQDEINSTDLLRCCGKCGQITDEEHFSRDIQFQDRSSGKNRVIGKIAGNSNYLSYSAKSDSVVRKFRTSEKEISYARVRILNLLDQIGVRPKQEISEASIRLYSVTTEISRHLGKFDNQILAVCCFIVCRQEKIPVMLLDFSDQLQVNLYTIGSIYINLGKHLYGENSFFNIPSDPSLYINRFAEKLNLGNFKDRIISTTICFINSMKRHWIQTGRNYSGIVGSALFMSLYVHNMPYKKREILKVTRIGNFTMHKRIKEFLKTDSSLLNNDKFQSNEKTIISSHEKVNSYVINKNRICFSLTQNQNFRVIINAKKCHHVKSKAAEPYIMDECFGCFISNSSIVGGMASNCNPPALDKSLVYDSDRVLGYENLYKENEDSYIFRKKSFKDFYQNNWANLFELNKTESKISGISNTAIKRAENNLTNNNHQEEDLSDLDLTFYKELIHTEDEAYLKQRVWREMII
jgi:transcription factor IIIB subunit 2